MSDQQIQSGSTVTPAPAPETAPAESAAPTASATPDAPKSCKHCGLEGAHVEPSEPIDCHVCSNAHGSTAKALDRQSGGLVDRRVIVTHSLEGVVREGDGWVTKPICTLCVADLKCRTYEAQRATPRGQQKPRWPNFWALHLAIEEAASRNAQRERDCEVQPRFDHEVKQRGEGFRKAVLFRLRENRSAGLASALDAELAVLKPLDALVAKFGSWARGVVFTHMKTARCSLETAIAAKSAEIEAVGKVQQKREALLAKGYRMTPPSRDERGERGGPRPERGDRRDRDGKDRGPRRDKRGNPSYGGRGYVTPDDVAGE